MEHFDHAHCSTPHVAALALQALMTLLAHTLASFQAPTRFLSSAVYGAVDCSLFGSAVELL